MKLYIEIDENIMHKEKLIYSYKGFADDEVMSLLEQLKKFYSSKQ